MQPSKMPRERLRSATEAIQMHEYPKDLFSWNQKQLDERFPVSGRRAIRRRFHKSQWCFTENVTLLVEPFQATIWYYLDNNDFITMNIRGRIGNDNAYYNYEQEFINNPFAVKHGKPYSFPFIEGPDKRGDA